MENFSGRVIKSYQVQDRIGAGGFGAVYRAMQQLVEREVAIKIILPEHANHPDFIRRFETEAQLVARLEHPYIVPLYDYWREPNGAYLVMRYLRGGSLRESLQKDGAWDIRRTTQLISQIGAALAFAHQHGVVHRDLKSDNILLDDIGNTYLTDFGIAKDLGANINLTKDAILGTPAYLAPEQIRGETATPASDIYALGILCYEVLAGSKPFYDASPATVLFKQLNDPLPDVTLIRSDLPAAVNAVLQQATAKEADNRFSDALSFARAFRTAASGAEVNINSTISGETFDVMSITEAERELFEPKNPYKGLRAFQQADAADFFGRQALLDRLIDRLREESDDNSFLAVVGPSGSGKSSVVKAGLLPALMTGMLTPEIDYYAVEMVPGTHPLEELEAALLGIATTPMPDLFQQLNSDSRGFIRAAKRILPDENSALVLLIDQFEEVFTLVDEESTRTHFLNSLLEAVSDPRSRIAIIITLRADFYDRPLLYAGFGELVRRRTELVLPMTREELEQTITGPARHSGLSLEIGLVEAIIDDVDNQPGALPLLQYALTELFERRSGRLMTLKAYKEIGGTTGALARRAEEVYNDLSPNGQAAARQLFLRLVALGDGVEDTRRRVHQAELFSLSGDRATIERVIEAFGKYRLLTFDRDLATRSSTVEIAHEALIRQWDRLRQWLDQNRENLRTQRWLTNAAQEWHQGQEDVSYLARGTRLSQLEEWAEQSGLMMNEVEARYLRASIDKREADAAVERERQQREAMLERRARNRLRITAAVMFVAAIIGSALAIFAAWQAQQADESRAIAEVSAHEARSLALAANSRLAQSRNDPPLALALALEAVQQIDPPPIEAVSALAESVYAPGPRFRFDGHFGATVLAAAFSTDGRMAASSSLNGIIAVWETQDQTSMLKLDLNELVEVGIFANDIAFSPDDRLIATALSDGSVRLWDISTGTGTASLSGHNDMVMSIAFNPDGSQLLSAGLDRTVILWDIESQTEVRRYDAHEGIVFRVSFAPDGKRFASSSGDATIADDSSDMVERAVFVWDIENTEPLLRIEPRSGFVRALAFAPDGRSVAVGTWDSGNGGTVSIFDAETGDLIQRFFGHTTPVSALAYSPDGRLIYSSAWDRTVRAWDLARNTEVQSFTSFTDRILNMAISPDGQRLLVTQGSVGDNDYDASSERGIDPTVWLWDLRNGSVRGFYQQHEDWLWTVAIHPEGEIAATGSGPLRPPAADSSVRVWNIDSGETLLRLEGHTDTVDSVKFHPDGQRLLSASWDGTIRLWDLETGGTLRTYTPYEGYTGRFYDIRFNADGSQFLAGGEDRNTDDASDDNRAWLFDTESGEILASYNGHERGVNSVAFSPDETRVATGSSDRQIMLWDTDSGELIQTLSGHTGTVNEVLFSPDGEYLFSTSWDDTVRMWDIVSGDEIRQFIGHSDNTFGLAISADGAVLLTTSTDKTMRMWDVASGQEMHRFEGHTDWVQEVIFSPDETFALSAGQDRRAFIWRIDRGAEPLTTFAASNRYLRPLNEAEQLRYRLDIEASEAANSGDRE